MQAANAGPGGGSMSRLLEPLSADDLDAVHAQAMRILTKSASRCTTRRCAVGSTAAGQAVDGTRVRWDPDFVMAQLALAPQTFTLTGRNPDRHVTVGGGSLVHSPVGGPPFAHDGERGRRDGTIADHIELVQLAHASDACRCCRAAPPRRRTSTTTAGTWRWTTRSSAGATGRSSSTAPAGRRRATASLWPPSRLEVLSDWSSSRWWSASSTRTARWSGTS